MSKLLQVDFDFTGPFGDEMTAMMTSLAESINQEPGIIWKIWTTSEQSQLGGGIYLFEDEATAQSYLSMHSTRLTEMGIKNIRGHIFDVNSELSAINNAPLA
ncbi:monooxygenase [Aliivibrio finisterrensis]|uniref:Monooxygenase n=1 Tax=Aliivibrio finisterrensis TaxID=511998 RepID=A0A4Q5KKM6_9GAMM|nr:MULTISPECIES: monooxygenase [Aliivibrio]MDD9173594.1 monooxygenase [Aliivibrio sp. S3TY1]MDD9190670.1 monooxygenase [Aliivibrio sp. S2TY2]RYU46904.1 monooxygenase [Aliivibrio finisterrensis]